VIAATAISIPAVAGAASSTTKHKPSDVAAATFNTKGTLRY
jgi:hypothetical protein